MTIIIYGDIKNKDIVCGDTFYRGCYDPKGLLTKYDGQSDLIVTLKLFVAKSNKFVALVDNITIA